MGGRFFHAPVLDFFFGYGNKSLIIVVIYSMKQKERRNPMEQSQKDPLNPKFDLNTQEGVRGFLEWLFDPKVDKAIEKFIEENGGRVDE